MQSEDVKQKALELGFDLAGIASAADPLLSEAVARYSSWLDHGYAATMEYLKRHAELKAHPERLLPEWKSVVCVALQYGETFPHESDGTRAKVSIYTRGADYHELLGAKLAKLSEWLASQGIRSRAFVDAEPVLERFWALRSGLGWIGKNAVLINRKAGSYLFLGGLLVGAELAPDEPGVDHCGRCRKCIDACPTAAITDARSLDAARCIAYHTIENRGVVPESMYEGTGRWIAGCDICQQVCPWNDPVMKGGAFTATNPAFDADLRELARWSADDYRTRMKGVAMARMKYSMFVRNVAIAVANAEGLSKAEKVSSLETLSANAQTLAEGPGREGALSALSWAIARAKGQG